MRTSAFAAVSLLLAPFAFALDKPLNIEVVKEVTCNRKTQRGDKIDVHYRGTLESDGNTHLPYYHYTNPHPTMDLSTSQSQVEHH
jgi:FK506-binding protein 2